MEELKVQLLALIQETFKCNRDQAQYFYLSIMECVKKKDLVRKKPTRCPKFASCKIRFSLRHDVEISLEE